MLTIFAIKSPICQPIGPTTVVRDEYSRNKRAERYDHHADNFRTYFLKEFL